MPAAQPRTAGMAQQTSPLHAALVFAFIFGLLFPGQIYLGELRISAYRAVLIATFIPSILIILQNPVKRFYTIDVMMIVYCVFCILSFLWWNNGIPTIGIFLVESLGPYLLARALISNIEQMTFAFKVFFIFVIALMPFTFYENLTGTSVLLEAVRPIFPYVLPGSAAEMRYNMHRPQVVFEHAILYGMFCTMVVAPAMYIVSWGKLYLVRLVYLALAVVATLLSLSAGPLVATGFQLLLIGWDQGFIIREIKWKIFIAMLLVAYVVVEVGSNRPPVHVFIDYFTFNAGTAFTRVRQWDCGMLSVEKNPILGFGLGGDWSRCPGVTNSIDNFFLAMAMRNGVPATLALLAMIVLIVSQVGLSPTRGRRESAAKRGVLIAIVGTSVGAATVHFWNATYVMLFFLLGSTMWLLDEGKLIARGAAPDPVREPEGEDAPGGRSQGRPASYARSSPARSRPGA